MPILEVEFEVVCRCGAGLCNQTTVGKRGGIYSLQQYVTIEPCERCMDAAHDKGYEEGYNDGGSE